jgi:hypothetical protein
MLHIIFFEGLNIDSGRQTDLDLVGNVEVWVPELILDFLKRSILLFGGFFKEFQNKRWLWDG